MIHLIIPWPSLAPGQDSNLRSSPDGYEPDEAEVEIKKAPDVSDAFEVAGAGLEPTTFGL